MPGPALQAPQGHRGGGGPLKYPRIAMVGVRTPRRKTSDLVLVVRRSLHQIEVVCCGCETPGPLGGCPHTAAVIAGLKPWLRSRAVPILAAERLRWRA